MNCDTCGKPFRGRELIEHNAGKLVHRKCRKAKAKHERITQTSTARRKRKAIDVDAVFARDRGVCALCGFDTTRIRPWLEALPSSWEVVSSPPPGLRKAASFQRPSTCARIRWWT